MAAWDLRRVLEVPSIYGIFRRLVGGDSTARLVREYLRPNPGDRVLDIGCGVGHLLNELGPIEYVGFDHNPEYIRAAQDCHGTRGKFLHGDVVDADPTALGDFDLIVAIGVLHHLDDDTARTLFRTAQRALRPHGRLVTFDGCFTPGQSQIARTILRCDRGRFVRTESEYRRLAHEYFPEICAHLRHDFIRIPYTHVILECRPMAAVDSTRLTSAA